MTRSFDHGRRRTRLLLLASASALALALVAAPVQLDVGQGLVLKSAQADKCCFRAGTKVLMADGSVRPIESLRVGDRVRGRGGRINTVLGVERTRLGRRRLWSINGSRPFVTAEHPFLGPDGWRAIDPGATALENPLLPVRPLARGDRLLRLVDASGPACAGGLALATVAEPVEEVVEVLSLLAAVYSEDLPLFNLRLDGDHTYVADGWLVHNKGGGGSSGGDDDDDDDGPSGGDDDDDDGPSGGGSAGGGGSSGGGSTGGGSSGDDDDDGDDHDSSSDDDDDDDHGSSNDDDDDDDDHASSDDDDEDDEDDHASSDDDDDDEDEDDDHASSDEEEDDDDDVASDEDEEDDDEDVASDDEEDEDEDEVASDEDDDDERPSAVGGTATAALAGGSSAGGEGGRELSPAEERSAIAGGWR